MAHIEVTVCDVCGEIGKPTRTYTLGRDGDELVEKDLCARHGAALDAILDGEAPAPASVRRSTAPRTPTETTPRRRRRTTPILTLAEIEERKTGGSS